MICVRSIKSCSYIGLVNAVLYTLTLRRKCIHYTVRTPLLISAALGDNYTSLTKVWAHGVQYSNYYASCKTIIVGKTSRPLRGDKRQRKNENRQQLADTFSNRERRCNSLKTPVRVYRCIRTYSIMLYAYART